MAAIADASRGSAARMRVEGGTLADADLVRSRTVVVSYSEATFSFGLPAFFTYRSSHAVHRAH